MTRSGFFCPVSSVSWSLLHAYPSSLLYHSMYLLPSCHVCLPSYSGIQGTTHSVMLSTCSTLPITMIQGRVISTRRCRQMTNEFGALITGRDERARRPAVHSEVKMRSNCIQYPTVQHRSPRDLPPPLIRQDWRPQARPLPRATPDPVPAPRSSWQISDYSRHPSHQWGIVQTESEMHGGTHQEVLEFSRSSLQPCRGVADHFFALAY